MRRRIDGQGRLVTEEVADHGRQHETERRVDGGNVDGRCGVVAGLAVVRHHDRRRLVGGEDRHLLRHVVSGRADEPGCAHQDQRLRRQVDVLLVLGGVARHRLVAELAELDSDLFGSHLVGSVADDGPIALGRREPTGSIGDHFAARQHLAHRIGEFAQRCEEVGASAVVADPGCLSDRAGQQRTGGHLGVEGLRRRHTHLDVAPVGRVEHAVGLVGEIATAPVDDADHRCTTRAQQVDRAVRVGGGSGLADCDRQRVAHVETHAEARQFGGSDRVHVEPGVGQLVENRGGALTGDRRRALADHPYASDRPGSEPGSDVGGKCALADIGVQETVTFDDLAAQRLREAERRLRDLLEQEVRRISPVDVSGGDLGGHDIGGRDGKRGSVVGESHDAVEIAGIGAVENDDLATLFTVHTDVPRGLLDHAVGLARHDVAVVCESDVEPLSAAAQREEQP